MHLSDAQVELLARPLRAVVLKPHCRYKQQPLLLVAGLPWVHGNGTVVLEIPLAF